MVRMELHSMKTGLQQLMQALFMLKTVQVNMFQRMALRFRPRCTSSSVSITLKHSQQKKAIKLYWA